MLISHNLYLYIHIRYLLYTLKKLRTVYSQCLHLLSFSSKEFHNHHDLVDGSTTFDRLIFFYLLSRKSQAMRKSWNFASDACTSNAFVQRTLLSPAESGKVIHLWRLKNTEFSIPLLLNTTLSSKCTYHANGYLNKVRKRQDKKLKKRNIFRKNEVSRGTDDSDAGQKPTWRLLESVGGSRWKTAGASDRSRGTGYQRVPGGSAGTWQQRI